MMLKKIALFLIAISLIFVHFPRTNSSSETPLSPPTMFQASLRESASGSYADSVRGHIKLIAVAISIGERLLIEKMPLKKLERAMRFQFSDNMDFLKGVRLRRVFYRDGVVKIPYRRDSAFYIVKISVKPPSSHQVRPNLSDKLEIVISRIR